MKQEIYLKLQLNMEHDKNLNKINWLKNNSIWQQRVIINGRVVKNNNSIILASNVIYLSTAHSEKLLEKFFIQLDKALLKLSKKL